MEFDISSLRRDAEKIEDPALREETLRDISNLQHAEFDLQRRLDEINREHRIKHRAYKPQTRFRLALSAILFLLGSIAMAVMLSEALATGNYVLSRSRHIITVGANPVAYWLYVGGLTFGIISFMFALLFCVLAFLRYPQPPFRWKSDKHKS